MTTRPVMLEARKLSVGYGGIPAVRNLDLEVRGGEVVALLGASGAGKTTTVMALAGALKPLRGEVLWRGKPTCARLDRRIRDGLALVHDERAVFMTLTVAENLRVSGWTAERALEVFPELRPHLRRKVGMLSGGQQQMLALGRALAAEPGALIADELSLGLAPIILKRLFLKVREAADRGVAVLLVEQFARQALEIADRAYVLKRGEIALSGAGEELLSRWEEIERAYLTEGGGQRERA